MSKVSKSSSSSSSSSKEKVPIKPALKSSSEASVKEVKKVSFEDQFKKNAREEDSDDEITDNIVNNQKNPESKERPPNAGKRWTDKEEAAMIKAFEKGSNVGYIAELFGRTERSIEYRAFHLIETELFALGYLENPSEYEGDIESICGKYRTTPDTFFRYVNLNNMRKERRAAHVLAKHNVADAIRQLDDGLYIKVAHVPSTKELREQMQIKDLNSKIEQLQAQVAALMSQLQENGRKDRNK